MIKNLFIKTLAIGALFSIFCTCPLWASTPHETMQQDSRRVTIIVNDDLGPIIGANIRVKGTQQGAITDMDGTATLENLSPQAVLQVSYMGYVTQEITVGQKTTFAVTLAEDTELLDEVVVVGYSTQAKKDITGAVSVVSAEDIAAQPVANFAEAIQGRAAGVYVNTAGGPAGDNTIRIRGVGNLNGSDPLVIVDGVQGVDIASVNPNDIESFQVMKDASATAIYGARAANGVIIITTKQGNDEDKVHVSYSGYVSASRMGHHGYNILGAWDYMKAVEQSQHNLHDVRGQQIDQNFPGHQQFGSIANGELQMPYTLIPTGQTKEAVMREFGSYEGLVNAYKPDGTNSYALSAYYYIKDILHGTEEEARQGTDWFDLTTRTGWSQTHNLSINGGGQRGQYALSLGYTNRQGAIRESNFERYNMRVNTTFNPTKHFTIGQNSNLSLAERRGEMGEQHDRSIFATYTKMNRWVAPYNVAGDYTGSQGNGGCGESALMMVEQSRGDYQRQLGLQSAFFAEIKDPWLKGLTIRSQFAFTIRGDWGLKFLEKTNFADMEGRDYNQLNENAQWAYNWTFTNTAAYKHTFADSHDLSLLIGTEALTEGIGRGMSAFRNDYQFEDNPNTWTLDNGGVVTQGTNGTMLPKASMLGYFARADYGYQGKYLATFTIRRDASSKFSKRHRWGTFPSFSLGWRISDEAFMRKAKDTWLDDLKLRAGSGSTGNSNIGAYNFAYQYTNHTRYLYGLSGTDLGANTGWGLSSLGDDDAKWETVKAINTGFDLCALHNRLTVNFDFYVKNTYDALVPANWTSLAGAATKPFVNIGHIRNTGIDLAIGWRDKIGEVGYNISANASWYKNKVMRLGASDLFVDTRISQMSITTEGQPISMFYGYVNDGIYKSVDEVLNYRNSAGNTVLPFGIAKQEDLVPEAWVGHFKWKDTNGDGRVTAEDRQIIGNPHPTLTGGLNIGLNWRNWDFSTYLYYSLGNDIYKQYELFTLWGNLGNVYTYDRVEKAWHPTMNPNGELPLWVYGDSHAEGAESHSYYVQDGSYLRMQTLSLGYSLPRKFVSRLGLSNVRFYAQLSNVFTLTGYNGLDPEVNFGSDLGKGIDYGSYGMPRQYLFGVNINL